jgi:DNA-binding IclR family transcriptional regulator
MAGNSAAPGRSVTSKVTAILMVFADGGVHTLTEIAGAANLPRSTAHRLASELVAWRLLERTEERSYRIGLPLRMIGSAYSKSGVGS